MAEPAREVIVSDGGEVVLRRLSNGCMAMSLVLFTLGMLLWVNQAAYRGWLKELAEVAPLYPGIAFGLLLFVRLWQARHFDADFPVAVARRNPVFKAVAEVLEGGRYEQVTPQEGLVTGRVDGLPVEVRCWTDPGRMPDADAIRYRVRFPALAHHGYEVNPRQKPGDPPRLRVRRAGGGAALVDDALAEALCRLFEVEHALKVEVDRDGLLVEEPATVKLLLPNRQRYVLRQLVALSRRFFRAPAAAEVSAAPVAVTEGTTCPFCRTELAAREAQGCRECGTPHHAACLREHGGCTVLGCRGAPPRGPRARGRA